MPNAIGLNVTIYPDGRVVEYLGSGRKRIVGAAVSLPEKHGRLIDADDMERFMSDTVQGDIRQYPYSDTLWDMAFKWIDSRPTIVEAEGD